MGTHLRLEGHLSSMGEAIDICGDGSILKEILTPGTGDETPTPGTKCTVHYVGTLQDGTKFDSSRDRNDPFKFTIGQGVITGWSEGVASMLLGEKANFTIQSHKAYGEQGSPPKIPGGATLVFEIELLGFTNDEEVTSDGGVTMKTTRAGEGWKTVEDMAKCKAHYTIAVDGTVVYDTRTEHPDGVAFVAGDGDVMRGIELSVEKMKQNQKALLKIRSDYAFGIQGSEAHSVPPHANVVVDLELIAVVSPKQPYEVVDYEPCYEEASTLKGEGNTLFKAGSFVNAIRRYDFALKFTERDAGLTDEQKESMKAVTVSCHLNTAQCYLKTQRPAKAKAACDKVIKLDSANIKALYRRGTALLDMSEFDLAKADLRKCIELDADNKAAAQMLGRIDLKLKQKSKKEKQMYGKMFK